MLSVHQLKIADLYNIPIGNVKKLVPDLFDKEKYVIHYESLKLYQRLRLKLKKIHCVLEFNQSHWLKQYVEFNTHKRIEAEKNSDKDVLKSIVKINECYIWKNNGKPKKQDPCKTCKQQKRLIIMGIRTKPYVTQNV